MGEFAADVALITADPELERAVSACQPPLARLRVLPAPGVEIQARETWIDLDSAPEVRNCPAGRRVYFHTAGMPDTAGLPPGIFIRKPCTSAVLEVLWAGVCAAAAPATHATAAAVPDGPGLPGWLLEYQELNLHVLCRKLVSTLGPRLGYQDVSLYLHDARANALRLAEAAHRRPVAPLIGSAAGDGSLMAAIARSGCWLRTTAVDQELALRHIPRCADRVYPDDACLIAPLISEGRLWGVLNFSGRTTGAADPDPGLPLTDIFAFIARALQHATAYERARTEARVDCLTGLFNQRWIGEVLDKEIRRAQRFHTALTLLVIDLDGLKAVNDSAGHLQGDCVLRHVADRISRVLRQFDSAARIGGDEFAVMLPATNLAGAQQVARRLLESVRSDGTAPPNGAPAVTASIGIAEWQPGWDAQALLAAADRAMYRAKADGRNTFMCHQAAADGIARLDPAPIGSITVALEPAPSPSPENA